MRSKKTFALGTNGSCVNFPARFPFISDGFPALSNGCVFSCASLWLQVLLCGLSAVSCFPAFTNEFIFSPVCYTLTFAIFIKKLNLERLTVR